ncbi:hypothetical protein KI387_016261, partial [Taxus chinensis]
QVKRKRVLVLFVTSLLVVIGSTISHATPEGNALLVIRERLHAETNWTGNDPCNAWDGVMCYQNHVVELNLSGKGLYGTIPKEVGFLSLLKVLDLSNNAINGSIPDEIANLTNLQTLILHNSRLSGVLPSGIQQLYLLESLYLGNCSFTGPLPALGKLINLKHLTIWGNNLNCTIPADIGKLKNLEYLNFHDSDMYGTLPPELGSLHKLQNLNLRCNYFVGPKPMGLQEFFYTGNCLDSDLDSHMRYCRDSPNCVFFYSQPENGQSGYSLVRDKKKNTLAIVGASVSAFLVLAILFVILYAWKIKKSKRSRGVHLGILSHTDPAVSEMIELLEPSNGVRRFELKELSKATEGFSKTYEIGFGGFGKVYKGFLDDGSIVAIKRASSSSIQGHKQFQNEIVVLSRLSHRCLVRLQGFCQEAGEQILVYEFMKNGNLNHLLSDMEANESLRWSKRIEISIAIAQGIDYLHSFVEPPIIHRDIKPSNILLDEHFNAKLSDFGISKSTPDFVDTHITTGPAGTLGYLDPQYFLRRQLTPSSDVYSFGVVLLVLISGQKAIDHTRLDEFNLVEWVSIKFLEGDIESIVDPNLKEDHNIEEVRTVIELALKCSAFERCGRPSIKEVLSVLEPLLKKKVAPPIIGSPVFDDSSDSTKSFSVPIQHSQS